MVFLGELNRSTFLVTLQFSDAELLRLLAQAGDIQQITRRIGQQAEAVDQFHFDLFQLVFVLRAGNAFIE
ncbi:Uncharacterised protein [Salmonella enterica subsp. enterica serovar Typhi]|nr:Uncharacterised protein [Salmonella enterica subsp. enterica serovar Typhi]CHL30457.1 Uncharacterised protein [Salmonella enterica subsp. enterica serovar Typhi]CQT95070.1 Uncharacterised protein [Salmonella enterica subsp. enterica serovar Typhi]CQW16415.1 Uncharacterised protein [Salmonella enterica subsp. enterica serovar Typhi]CQY35821.1 Uncharacterised protein [Salmonella enterica subsp. enterica serovar Typhi]